MRSRILWFLLLLLLILFLLWLFRACQREPVPEPGACNGVRSYTSTPALFIPDALLPGPGTPQPVNTTLAISDTGTINDLNVSVTVHLPEHGELVLDLTSPGGTTVRFKDTAGGVGDGLENVTFDDEAGGPPPNFVTNGVCWVNQDFQPAPDSLSDFDGEAINGTWTLTVTDVTAQDAVDCDCDGFVLGPACPRTLDEWTLEIDCSSEEPAQ